MADIVGLIPGTHGIHYGRVPLFHTLIIELRLKDDRTFYSLFRVVIVLLSTLIPYTLLLLFWSLF